MPMPHPPDLPPAQSCPGMPTEAQELVFNAPWEAKAFAIVNQLTTLEHCTWPEWTQYLAAVIAAIEQETPDSMAYYQQWVVACERLLADKGLLDAQEIEQKIHTLVAEQKVEHGHQQQNL